MLPWKFLEPVLEITKGTKSKCPTHITCSTYIKIVDCGLIKKEDGVEHV